MTVDSLDFESHAHFPLYPHGPHHHEAEVKYDPLVDNPSHSYSPHSSNAWVREMERSESLRQQQEQQIQTPHKKYANEFDDHISLHSTPPTQRGDAMAGGALDSYSTTGGGKTSQQLQKLKEMKLLQNTTVALRWLSSLPLLRSRSIPIMSPLDSLQPDGSFVLPYFADGVLFCQLIACLTRCSKQPILGCCEKPHNRAQKVQNIRRFLDMLTKTNKSDFPVHIKSFEEDILAGKGEVIVKLLLKMKDCYKYFKTNDPLSSLPHGTVAETNTSHSSHRQRLLPRHSH